MKKKKLSFSSSSCDHHPTDSADDTAKLLTCFHVLLTWRTTNERYHRIEQRMSSLLCLGNVSQSMKNFLRVETGVSFFYERERKRDLSRLGRWTHTVKNRLLSPPHVAVLWVKEFFSILSIPCWSKCGVDHWTICSLLHIVYTGLEPSKFSSLRRNFIYNFPLVSPFHL